MGVKIDAINARIDKIESHLSKCPIQMEAIQFYAENFETSNQNYNELHTEILDIKKSLHLILDWIKEKKQNGKRN